MEKARAVIAATLLITGGVMAVTANAQTSLPRGARIPRIAREHVRFVNPYTTKKPHTTKTTTKTPRTKLPVRKKGEGLNEMLEKLNLSSAQRTQIQQIESKANTDGKAVFDDKTLTSERAAQKLHEIDGTMVKEVENVLTAAQRKKLEAEQDANARKKGGTTGLSGPAPAAR